MSLSNATAQENRRLLLGLNRYGCWVFCLFDSTYRFCSGKSAPQSIGRQRAAFEQLQKDKGKAREDWPDFAPMPNTACGYDRGERSTDPSRKVGAACPDCGDTSKIHERTWETACTLDAFVDLLQEHAGLTEMYDAKGVEGVLSEMREWAAEAIPGAVNCQNNVMWCITVDPEKGDPDGNLDQNRGYEQWETLKDTLANPG